MNGQAITQLSPEAQVVLIVCLLALATMILMIVFLIIADRRKMDTFMAGTDEVTKSIAHMRKDTPPPSQNSSDSSSEK